MSIAPLKILCLGDIVARPGREVLARFLPTLREELKIDLVIANGENAAGGSGIDPKCAKEIFGTGVDLITLGDHTWRRREVKELLEAGDKTRCIRPANFAEELPGQGWIVKVLDNKIKVGVMNLMGRTFMNTPLDCPFRKADKLLAGPLADCSVVVCDMHAEATSEKIAMGRYLDGRVSVCFGTHTHVPTADSQLLAEGTAYVTDLGMCGSSAGVIGLKTEVALERFLKGIPSAYKPATELSELQGILVEVDLSTAKATKIDRVIRREECLAPL